MKTIGFLLILCFAFCVLSAHAQKRTTKRKTPPKKIVNRVMPSICTGGVVNSKAVSLPKPEYPKAVKTSGTVIVQVKIDEQGNVIEAKVCSGHPLLRAEAEKAAKQAKIRPTILSGIPVKVSGIIVYNFIPPE